eukprot:843358-Amphidinium_carterae.1
MQGLEQVDPAFQVHIQWTRHSGGALGSSRGGSLASDHVQAPVTQGLWSGRIFPAGCGQTGHSCHRAGYVVHRGWQARPASGWSRLSPCYCQDCAPQLDVETALA